MLKIGKNNFSRWELLLKVLSGEMPDHNLVFQRWLKKTKENKMLYLNLKRKSRKKDAAFDQDKMFKKISDIVGLSDQKKVSIYRTQKIIYTASFFTIVTVVLSSYFILSGQPDPPTPIEYTKTGKNVFNPGSKKAYLLSSEGKTIDLSKDFELRNDDGTIISNKSKGVVHFRQDDSGKKKIEQHTIYVPKNGEYELLLADGSKVYLNSESQLIFPSYFDGETRVVELTGEAYFEIKKGDKPFIVKTAEMQVEVLGTSFNINTYQNNAFVHATLVEGSVRVHIPDNPDTFCLATENNIHIHKSSNTITIRNVNPEIYTAWVKGIFAFRNQTLHDIFTQLARWYDFEIEYENPAIQSMRFTGSAEKVRSLDYLLNQIIAVTDIKYKNEGEKIILY